MALDYKRPIGKGKARAPYEFGVKASIVTTTRRAPGGQFVLHATSLPGNPYDGHTLAGVIDDTEKLTGRPIERAYVDKGYRGHDTTNPRRVFLSGQTSSASSGENSGADRLSRPSSDTSRTTAISPGASSRAGMAMLPTSFSAPSDTTCGSSCAGSKLCYA